MLQKIRTGALEDSPSPLLSAHHPLLQTPRQISIYRVKIHLELVSIKKIKTHKLDVLDFQKILYFQGFQQKIKLKLKKYKKRVDVCNNMV